MRSRGLTTTRLSLELGLSHSVVRHWLVCGDSPTVRSCHKLSEYAGVPLERVLSLCGHLPRGCHLPNVRLSRSEELPEFGEYTRRKYPGVFDDDVITMIWSFIDVRRDRMGGSETGERAPRSQQRVPATPANAAAGSRDRGVAILVAIVPLLSAVP